MTRISTTTPLNGLEIFLKVQDNVTKKWQNIEPKPNSFVVNCGIMLEKMTRGRLRSTIHRVLDHSEERMSAPFFLEPGWNKKLYGNYD